MNRFTTWLMRYDDTLISYVNQQWKCRFFDVLMPRITHLGGATAILLFLLCWFVLIEGERKWWAIEGLIAVVGSHAIVRLLKYSLPRIRPYLQLHNLHTFPKPLTDYSFPSGHTTAVFSISMIFILHESSFIPVFLPIAILVALSRMYLALHYPTDVLIGTCLGICSAILTVYSL